MKITVFICVLILIISNNGRLSGENAEAAFKSKILKTYNFKPSKLSKKEQNEKAKLMDGFWSLVGSDLDKYLPLLRKELQIFSNNGFFLYDGAKLLLKHSKKKEDLQIILNAIVHSSLEDIDKTDYFYTVHYLARQDINTWPAVNRILDDPKFEAFIVQHYLQLNQNNVVLYSLLVMKDEHYLSSLIERLKQEKNPVAARTIITSIAYTISGIGQKALTRFVNTTNNKELKSYAQKFLILQNKKDLPKKTLSTKREHLNIFLKAFLDRNYDQEEFDFKSYYEEAPYHVKKEDYAMLKEMRRKRAGRISDEAIDEINYLSMLLQYAFTSED